MVQAKITKEQEPIKEPVKEVEKESEMVSVSKDFLADLQGEMKSMKESQNMLLEVADKTQLSRFYSRNQKKLPSVVGLRMLEGKIIIGWGKMKDNDVYEESKGKITEIQTINLVLEDKTTKTLSYKNYIRQYTTQKAKVISTTENENGDIVLNVERLDNGKKYSIGIKFVN